MSFEEAPGPSRIQTRYEHGRGTDALGQRQIDALVATRQVDTNVLYCTVLYRASFALLNTSLPVLVVENAGINFAL